MAMTVVRATLADRDTLRSLMQLYAYDFSDILGLDVEDDGRFVELPLDAYWQDAWRSPFLIRAGGRLAGFALVHQKSRLSGADDVWDMAEFFVVRKHRRAGVGREAAHRLFGLHVGNWEVRERKENVAATAFWRNAIGTYTQFTEQLLDDARWCGPVQSFVSEPR